MSRQNKQGSGEVTGTAKGKSAEELIQEIEMEMGRSLTHPAHVCFMFASALSDDGTEDLKKIMFTSKYVTGLKKIVSQGTITDDKYKIKIFQEFNDNVKNLIDLLDKYVSKIVSPEATEFRSSFLGMDHASLAKVLELAEDMSLCKEFFNRNESSYPGFKFTPEK